MKRPIVFMDTETTGLDPDDHIWEWAAVRREPGSATTTFHCFVEHDPVKAANLPEPFRTDHDTRYDPDAALPLNDFVELFSTALAGQPRIVGAVPNFDTERLTRILHHYGAKPMWHYHLRDAETLAEGYLLGRASRGDRAAELVVDQADDSDALSRAVGVDPTLFARHTALGDAHWAMAIHDVVHKATS